MFLLLPALILVVPRARAESWLPVPREQLELARPVVDRQADAEAFFWDVRAEDSFSGTAFTTELWHHVRLKVFTERGRESQSRIDLVYDRGQQIDGISARVISPDGRITELALNEVYERTLLKASGVRTRVKTFVLANVEVGSVVEYRWREFRGRNYRYHGLFELQRDIPVQRITYHVKPLGFREAPPLQLQAYNIVPTQFESEGFGVYATTVSRIPAFVEEPTMPPEREVRMWMVMYYGEGGLADPVERWRIVARDLARLDENLRRAGRDLKRSAAEIAGDDPNPEERLKRLYTYCGTRIRNLDTKAAGLTEEERSRLKPTENPRETLESKQGIAGDISRLFAVLASGAGFEVRWARVGDGGFIFFKESMLPWFLTAYDVAVRLGTEWRFFDVANPRLRFGALRWQEEGVPALIYEQGEALWLKTPLSPGSYSGVDRSGRFRLLADGTLEGEGRIVFSGHLDVEEKARLEETSAEDRERAFRERLIESIPAAEVTDVRYEHLESLDSSLVLHYRLRVPAYAKTTGTRLFLQPAVFQYGRRTRFETSTRKNAIDFRYPWHEQDSLVVELPAGFALDHPDTPADYDVPGVCEYRVVLGTTHEDSRVVYRRRFLFDRYYFERRSYPALKETFDAIHERDQHALALRHASTVER